MASVKTVKNAVARSIGWFVNSGVMTPYNGQGGVAERILVLNDAALLRDVENMFKSWTPEKGYYVIESRRADCNFQAALMFKLAESVFPYNGCAETSENLLDYLYFRSGLLNRLEKNYPYGGWFWSNTLRNDNKAWLDDNSWCVMIQLWFAAHSPEAEKRYGCRMWAETLLKSMADGFERSFMSYSDMSGFTERWQDPEKIWHGFTDLPHWGGLVSMALLSGVKNGFADSERYMELVRRWFQYFAAMLEKTNSSELCYGLMAASYAANLHPEEKAFRRIADSLAEKIIAKADPETLVLPSEHYEAPSGGRKADMIYTVNWELAALQAYSALTCESRHREAYEKLLAFVVSIQDKSRRRAFAGCWRGMYDMEAGTWGGGDRVEGGAGSIYSGWTNAPVCMTLMMHLAGKSLLDF